MLQAVSDVVKAHIEADDVSHQVPFRVSSPSLSTIKLTAGEVVANDYEGVKRVVADVMMSHEMDGYQLRTDSGAGKQALEKIAGGNVADDVKICLVCSTKHRKSVESKGGTLSFLLSNLF